MTIAHCTSVDERADTARSLTAATTTPARAIRVGLLGLGHVGSAVARGAGLAGRWRIQVTTALVRDRYRRRNAGDVAVTTDAEAVFASRPDVIVEALGGLEPARALVVEALSRGIPVVTANKTLLAHHGEEIFEASERFEAPVRYEASVIAGVPFLGTFAGRPHASRVTAFAGIVNGTTNFILSQIAGGQGDYDAALAEAQRCGYAEPDPSKDVRGIDAAEKLAILIWQFSGRRARLETIETTGIETIDPLDFAHARALGGTIKPVVAATGLYGSNPGVAAFSGPAFVPFENPLARLTHTTNGLCLQDVAGGHLSFTGPGAGPDVTAVTVLDDVIDAATSRRTLNTGIASLTAVASPATPWLLRLTHAGTLPPSGDIPAILAGAGVLAARTSIRTADNGRWSHAILTHACDKASIERAALALSAATGSTTRMFRGLDRLA
jgi:homoserine dehydrogenase